MFLFLGFYNRTTKNVRYFYFLFTIIFIKLNLFIILSSYILECIPFLTFDKTPLVELSYWLGRKPYKRVK